ncbi:MAG: adenylate kinase [Rickettsia endosymbiont of Bryobia graminum]|nr:adenylate kinase [Rickettsia endosymbiont of Bryobia graminum]
MIIVLMGPPGSGKGTQGKLLAEKLNLPHVSVGNIFREVVESGNEEGSLVQDYMSKGKLVPSELVNRVVQKFLSQNEYETGCVLDGYPRNLEQAKFLDQVLSKKESIKVLFFDINDQIIIQRILGRFTCASCGQIYNQFFVKPKIDNVCDICGSHQFVHRKDDDEQTAKNRVEEYKAETYPLIYYYKNNNKLHVIDASQSMEDIGLVLDKLLKII